MAYKYLSLNKRRSVTLSDLSEDEDIVQKCDDQNSFAEEVQSLENKKENDDSDYSDHEDEISSEEFLSKITTVLRKEYGSKLQNKLSEVSKSVDDHETALKTFNDVLENNDIGHEQEVKIEHHHDEVACATCSRKKRVESTTVFKKGQHIRIPGQHLTFTMFKTQVRVYSHHAIIKEVKRSCLNKAELVLIHFQKVDDKIKIYESTEIIDMNKDDIDIIEYQRPRHNPEEIVRRAESMLPKDNEEHNEFGKYYLFFQNCEHFATWCVVGESESFQVQGFFRSIGKWFSKVTGTGAAVGRFVARILMNSADEIATGFNAGLHLPGVFVCATALLYLIYCIGETIISVKRKNKSLCNTCFKNKMTKLWAQCAAFLTTSGLSYILVHFAIPSLLIPGYGIPIMIVLVFLSLALQWGISKIIDYLKSPFVCEKKSVINMNEIEVGDVLEVKYWGLPHAVVVTEVNNAIYDETQGRVRCVHYGIPTGKIYGTRQIVEEYMILDTKKEKIVKLDDSILKTNTPEEVVERARLRIGETKWNPLTNRSEHLAFFAKVKEDDTESESSLLNANADDIGQSSSKHKSSFFVGECEVHQRDQIRPGHIIKLNDRTCMVLEVSDEDSNNKRCFQIEILIYKNFFSSTSMISVNLDNDRIFIQKYLETRCYSMTERVQRARNEIGKRRFFLTKAGFFESIVENK